MIHQFSNEGTHRLVSHERRIVAVQQTILTKFYLVEDSLSNSVHSAPRSGFVDHENSIDRPISPSFIL